MTDTFDRSLRLCIPVLTLIGVVCLLSGSATEVVHDVGKISFVMAFAAFGLCLETALRRFSKRRAEKREKAAATAANTPDLRT